jgi:hypothetical protein
MNAEPIACSLSASDLAERRASLLARVGAAVVAHRWLSDGLRLDLADSAGGAEDVLELVRAEHQCCRFLRFRLELGPGASPVTLELTGPEGTVGFLATLGLVTPPAPTAGS